MSRPRSCQDRHNFKMLIVKIPFINGLGKTKGCEKAPDILAKNAEEIETDNANVEESTAKIFKEALRFLKSGKRVLFIGGDHSISYPLARAFAKSLRKKKCLVVFDAHADCMKPLPEPTHEEWLRAVIEEKLFDKIVLIGLRKIEPEEEKFLKGRKEAKVLSKNEIVDLPNDCEIYLSIDMDVFDPDIAPGTGYLEPKGMTKEEFYNLVDKIKSKAKAIDLIEVNPEKDLNNKTVKLALDIIDRLK